MTTAASPSEPAASLYVGRTVHERRAPFTHRFTYRIASVLLDLDQLDAAGAQSRLFSIERFNLYSFKARDHGPRDGSDLALWARTRFKEAGLDASAARLTLLCAPRVLGYVFNPLSIYFAQDRQSGQLIGVLYQVHNTFGDSHVYVVPGSKDAISHQEADKVFHVSPFFDVGGRYQFTIRTPSDRFHLTIVKQRDDGSDFLASMAMAREEITSSKLTRLFLSQPFSTLKTVAAIHFEALRLWMKGAVYHSRPTPPNTPSYGQLTPSPRSTEFVDE